MHQKAIFSTRTRMEEEDADEREADSAKNKADDVRPTKNTPNLRRKTEAIEEPLQEAGVSTPGQAVKTQSNVDIAESSAITKKSAERRSENLLSRADNARIMHTITTTKIIEECMRTTRTMNIVAEYTHITPTTMIKAECS